MTVNASTKSLCLLGHPVSHSFSPAIHNAISESLNLNNVYVAYDVEPKDLQVAVKGLGALGFKGANVTVPHKTEVMPYLTEISKEAKIIGAVNTISFDNNRLIGYNTDCIGFEKMLIDEDVSLRNKKVLILGAGGAARAVVAACITNESAEIHVCSRDIMKSQTYINAFDKYATAKQLWKALTYSLIEINAGYDIVVNCTPLGMHPHEGKLPIDPQMFSNGTVLVDLIYNPQKTEFLLQGERLGMKVINGLGMLIHQALEAYRIWNGNTESAEFVRKALSEQGIK